MTISKKILSRNTAATRRHDRKIITQLEKSNKEIFRITTAVEFARLHDSRENVDLSSLDIPRVLDVLRNLEKPKVFEFLRKLEASRKLMVGTYYKCKKHRFPFPRGESCPFCDLER